MKETVSAVIAVLLLGMYSYAVWTVCWAPGTAPSAPIDTVLSLVGALVAALVIAVLAITPPATSPGRTLAAAAGGRAEAVANWVVNLYLLVWLVCGIALVVTWMRVPDATAAVVSAAKSWLGLAIAAAYAFFGLKR